MDDASQGADDRRGQIRRKISDLAWILPVIGVILFATPMVFAVSGGGENAVPRATLFIFLVWGGLIAAAYGLARFLRGDADPK